MSVLAMPEAEIKTIDSKVEQMMDWATSRQAEAEQLALDSARLMACTTDRLDKLSKQNFFVRCWSRYIGETDAIAQANVNDVIQMQKTAFRYINMLQERQLLMAHSLLSLKNNLVSLAIKEKETRELIGELAQRTLQRFKELEKRVDQLEISTNLQGWLLGLEERDYDEEYPTDYMRMFRVLNDFYSIKNDNWNYNDLMFMRKAIRTVGLNPKEKISLNNFINKLTDEIQSDGVGFDLYGEAITMFAPQGIENYSQYVLDNISSPVFVTLHGLKTQYMDRLDVVEDLQDEMNISTSEALKRLLRRSIARMNVDLDYEFPLAETAIELLGCIRLSERLTDGDDNALCDNDDKSIDVNSNVNNNKTEKSDEEIIQEIKEFILSYDINFRLLKNVYSKNGPLQHNFSYVNLYPYDAQSYTQGKDILIFIKNDDVKYIITEEFIGEFDEKNMKFEKIDYFDVDTPAIENGKVIYYNLEDKKCELLCNDTPTNYLLLDLLKGIDDIILKNA